MSENHIPLSQSTMLHEDYAIRLAESNETTAILSFLHKYLADEIITVGFFKQNGHRITTEEKKYMDEEYRDFVDNSPCFIAVHRDSQEIVGVVILQDFPRQQPSKSKIIQDLEDSLVLVNNAVGLDQMFGKRRTVKLRSLAVHTDHRGKGFAKALMKEGIEWSRKHNYKFVYSFFTLPAAVRAADAVGLKFIGTYDLTTICNKEGNRLYADMSPYNVTTIMVVEL